MADISQQINAINSARYGEEVRGSIVTALTAVNDQVEADETSAGASATAAAASAAQAQAAEANLADAIAAAEQTEEDIEAAEALRVTAEQGRVDAENARVAAEQARESAETGYVAQAQAAAAQAQQYASSDYVKTAQSWAIGGTSSRYGEDTNNAKYWAEIAAEVVTEGGVGSFNGRTGQVLPAAGDYDTTLITRGTGSAESALAAIEAGIGTTTLPTTAQTLTGAIAEHESDITALNGKTLGIRGQIGALTSWNIDQMAADESYGVWWLNNSDSDLTGTKPTTSGQGVLFCERQSSGISRQLYLGATAAIKKVRYYTHSTSTWSAWEDCPGTPLVTSWTGTLSGQGNLSHSFGANVIVLSAWTSTSDTVVMPYPSGGTTTGGASTWWFHVRACTSAHAVVTSSVTITACYILV